MAASSPQTSPHKAGNIQRPLSPHISIYHWAVTMIVSITHRATGMALAVGAVVLAAWLFAISNGPEGYQEFYAVAATPLGLVALFGFTWALLFHMLNGIRHLFWDLGYGFKPATAKQTGLLVIALSLILSAVVFITAWTGHAGYLQ